MRQVYFKGTWHETDIYSRLELPVGAKISGPAILEQPDTTVLIEPGLVGKVDAFGNTLIERAQQ
jgi:N-methylhydantoinase A